MIDRTDIQQTVRNPMEIFPVAQTELSTGGESLFAQLLGRSTASAGNGEKREEKTQPVHNAQNQAVLELRTSERSMDSATVKRLARILWQAQVSREPEITLSLRPDDLGSLVLKISMREDEVHVQALSENPDVARLLLASLGDLKDALAKWGLKLGSFDARVPENEIQSLKGIPNPEIPKTPEEKAAALAMRGSYTEVIA
ncbi:MAG: flagellar hook-length control protein FliK [Pseudomonadota bacterium]